MSNNSFTQYNTSLITRARDLRKNSTLSEVLLWNKLKGKQLLNYKFRRQVPILNFIVDFYCNELRLAIEIDGLSHDAKIDYDIERQKKIEGQGVRILRFSDLEIKRDLVNVVQRICDWIDANPPLPCKVPAWAGSASRPGVGSTMLTNPPLPRPSGESNDK
ncbi:MAG: endonuclease domain-containing protein [Patescibacteria group bacterium]